MAKRDGIEYDPLLYSLKADPVDMCQQQFAASTDINNVVQLYIDAGFFDGLADPLLSLRRGAFYADTTEFPSFEESAKMVADFNSYFSELPHEVQARYDFNAAAYFEQAQFAYERSKAEQAMADVSPPEVGPVDKPA